MIKSYCKKPVIIEAVEYKYPLVDEVKHNDSFIFV